MTVRSMPHQLRLNSGELGRIRRESRQPITLHELALRAMEVARQGYWVFPCYLDKKQSKRPCTKHGKDDATDHPDKAYRLFMAHKNATLIGVKTGVDSGILGIDIDPKGHKWFLANFRRLGNPLVHTTPRGGLHLVYKLPGPPTPIIGCRQVCDGVKLLAEGVDIKGEGGSLVWAGSLGYAVVHDVTPPEVPRWMLRLLLRQPKPQPERQNYKDNHDVRFDAILTKVRHSRTGSRNEMVFWGGCRAGEMVAAGKLGMREAIERVAEAGKQADRNGPDGPLDHNEAYHSAASGVKRGMRDGPK